MTENGQADTVTIKTIIQKISLAVQNAVSPEKDCRLTLMFRVFPQEMDKLSDDQGDIVLDADISKRHAPKRHGPVLKRAMDIFGSLVALIAFLPAFAIIALLVKLTSKGPVLFCQKRMGQYGKEFRFYKFRTMYADNDPQIHR